jgi:hypothetical protein
MAIIIMAVMDMITPVEIPAAQAKSTLARSTIDAARAAPAQR